MKSREYTMLELAHLGKDDRLWTHQVNKRFGGG